MALIKNTLLSKFKGIFNFPEVVFIISSFISFLSFFWHKFNLFININELFFEIFRVYFWLSISYWIFAFFVSFKYLDKYGLNISLNTWNTSLDLKLVASNINIGNKMFGLINGNKFLI